MNYLIHSALLLAACWLYYRLVLRRETHFRLNRYVLLGSMVACFLLPLITVPAYLSVATTLVVTLPTTPSISETTTSVIPPGELPIVIPKATDATSSVSTKVRAATDWPQMIWYAYLLGVLVFGLHFLAQLLTLLTRVARNPVYEMDGVRVVELDSQLTPHSFWKYVFINPGIYDLPTYRSIIAHEHVHISQRHTIDLLLAELVIVVQWCNPFAWLYRRAIENNLEYLTDAEILHGGTDPIAYQMSLLQVAVPGHAHGLVTHYNQNFLEQRIMMMKAKRSTARSGWKYLALPALLLVSLSWFNPVAARADVMPEIAQQPLPPAPPAAPATAPVPPSTPPPPPPAPAAAPAPPPPPPLPPVGKTRRSWTAEIDGSEVCMALIETGERGNSYRMNTNYCFATSELGSLPRGAMGDFSLTRAAGTLKFRGLFEGNTGIGTYEYVPAPAFTAALEQAGFGTFDDRELVHFFLTDITPDYLTFLKQQYEPSHDELVQVAVFGIDRATLTQVSYDLKEAGYGEPGLENIVQLRIFGIDKNYFAELAEAGFDDLTLDKVVQAKIHGISPDFVRQMTALGFSDLTFDEIVNLAIHGIDAEYAQEMASLGYDDLSAEAIVSAKIHGVNARKAKEMQDLGLTFSGIRDLQDFSIHGVTPELVKGLRDLGYTELGVRDFIDARIHGVTPEFVVSYADLGYGKIPFRTLVDLRIHGVSPDFIRDNRREGDSLRDLIDYKIMRHARR